MLLTLTTTHNPATDLGYLLHKNPANLHSFDLSFGKAHVFYSEATKERCTAALLLDVDPIGLVRGKRGQHEGGTLDQYVNDRPYVLSSFLSVAMGRAFGTAMSGRSKGRQELADHAIPLTAKLTVVACRAGEGLIRELFEPLGYSVTTEHHPLDEKFPEWGEGPYYSVTLAGTFRLQDVLNHLYVLVPVLDAEKHYWIGKDEVEKLLRKGEPYASASRVFEFGPGCSFRRLFAREDLNVVLYWISVWNTLHFNVKIDLEDELMQADQRASRVQGMPADLNGRAMQISGYLRNQLQPDPLLDVTKRHS